MLARRKRQCHLYQFCFALGFSDFCRQPMEDGMATCTADLASQHHMLLLVREKGGRQGSRCSGSISDDPDTMLILFRAPCCLAPLPLDNWQQCAVLGSQISNTIPPMPLLQPTQQNKSLKFCKFFFIHLRFLAPVPKFLKFYRLLPQEHSTMYAIIILKS